MKIERLDIIPRSSWKTSTINDSTNDVDPINVPKIRKPKSRKRKRGGSDIKWSNPWKDKATHFVNYIESPNVDNSSHNCKNTGTTSDVGPTLCVAFAKEGKTHVGWVVVIGQKTRRWTKTNNIPPNGSPYRVPNFDKMTMRSPCWET